MPRGSSKLYNLSYVGRENSGRKKIKLRDGIMEDIFKESLAVSVDESVRANFLDSLSIKSNASTPSIKYIFLSNRLSAFVFIEVCAVC